jgi:tetratricopeptide (TPR) repeat protein
VERGGAAQVIRAVPRRVAVLVTARQRYAVDEILEVGKLDVDDALRLLGHHARQDFSADPDAHELCRQVGYHAFALEVAGKTLRVDRIAPAHLLERIASRPHDIAMPESFAEEGRSSIRELLDASLNALDDESRKVFLAYGVLFVPSATPELLARLLGHPGDRITETLLTLQRRGLAEQVRQAAKNLTTFRIHDLAYSYARTIRHSQEQTREAAIVACRDFTVIHENDLEALDAEHGNIFGAAQKAREMGRLELLIDIMRVLIGRYLAASGHDLPFLELLDAVIAATEAMGPDQNETRHLLLSKRGNAYYDRGNLTGALECYQEALELARLLEKKDREVILLSVIGMVRSDQNQEDAESYLEQAYQLATALQDDFLIGFALEHQGDYAQSKGDFEATRRIVGEQVALAERSGDHETLFYALVNLGFAEGKLGEPETALTHHRARRPWLASTIIGSAASALQGVGEDQHQLDNHEEAAVFHRAPSIFEPPG